MFSRQALFLLLSVTAAQAFVVLPASNTPATTPTIQHRHIHMNADSWSDTSSSGGGAGSIEQIEFKIHSDGRIEETVRGVKGNNCHKVTEKINEALGEVVATTPTEEMFETEVTVNEKIYQTDGDWEGSSSW